MTTDIVERLHDLANNISVVNAAEKGALAIAEILSLRARAAELEAELRDAFVQLRMCRVFVSGHEQMTPTEQEQNDAVIAGIEETLLGSKDVVAIARAEGRAQGIREAAEWHKRHAQDCQRMAAKIPGDSKEKSECVAREQLRAAARTHERNAAGILSLLPNEKEKS